MRAAWGVVMLGVLAAACERPAEILVVTGVVAIRDGKIVAVGDSAEVAGRAGRAAEVIDAGGGLVMPGFADGHTHFIDGGFQLASVDLRDAATPAEFVRRLGAYAAPLRPGEWITGGDWDHEL